MDGLGTHQRSFGRHHPDPLRPPLIHTLSTPSPPQKKSYTSTMLTANSVQFLKQSRAMCRLHRQLRDRPL